MRPTVKAMIVREFTYVYGAVSPSDGKFDSLVLPHADTPCMQAFIDEVASRYSDQNIIMIVDGASWHKSRALRLPDNLKTHLLPAYSPELNPQEHIWDELREKHFHNKAFENMQALTDALVMGLQDLEAGPQRVKSIAGWDWIINSVSNYN